VRWANVQAIDDKFSQDLTYTKSLKSFNFWQELFEKYKGGRFWHTVYLTTDVTIFVDGPASRFQLQSGCARVRQNVSLMEKGESWVESGRGCRGVVEADTVVGRRSNWLSDDPAWPRTKHIDIDSRPD